MYSLGSPELQSGIVSIGCRSSTTTTPLLPPPPMLMLLQCPLRAQHHQLLQAEEQEEVWILLPMLQHGFAGLCWSGSQVTLHQVSASMLQAFSPTSATGIPPSSAAPPTRHHQGMDAPEPEEVQHNVQESVPCCTRRSSLDLSGQAASHKLCFCSLHPSTVLLPARQPHSSKQPGCY